MVAEGAATVISRVEESGAPPAFPAWLEPPSPDCLAGFTERLVPVLAIAAADADRLDVQAGFPEAAIAGLRRAGALRCPLRPDLGGLGVGTTEAGAACVTALLRSIGRANLSLGRIFEGHLNALRLIDRYGTEAQIRAAAADAVRGHLFAIWATEKPATRVVLDGGLLHGTKSFASAAGFATRPLITVHVVGKGDCLALVELEPGQRLAGPPLDLHGMRAAATAPVCLDGIALPTSAIIGEPGDYMRQPEISLGAWRALAVILGGLDGLVEHLARSVSGQRSGSDPLQRARLGQALIARETAALWVNRCGMLAEADDAGEPAANYVKLARVAVEQACNQAVQLAQRSLGLTAFVRPHPVERLCRDLATYLRQPAMDMVLDEAATYFADRDLP
jgi:alkylation response protein AidB-like acyl-CoA dehydrogenase